MARTGGVTAIDLNRGRVVPILVKTKLAHGVALVGTSRVVVATSEDDASLIWFDGATGRELGRTSVGKEPDGVVYDPATNAVVSINGDDLTIVDAATRKVAGSVPLEGEPEFGVVDGRGRLYDNIRDRAEIAVVNLRSRQVVGKYALKNCEEATGLAYDRASNLLISVCGNGVTKFVQADTGDEIASIPVGGGADAVILDSKRRIVFIPSGHSGTLSIISLEDASDPKLVQVVKTPIGTRTGAVDSVTGAVYLPSAMFVPVNGSEWPAVKAGTMKFLVLTPSR
jgi:DNA-binding beta-propeller fold protein YncE